MVATGVSVTLLLVFLLSNPKHRWVHISNQTRDEVLIYAGYDSGRQPMFPLFHTSVTVPFAGVPEPRISADAVVHVWLDDRVS